MSTLIEPPKIRRWCPSCGEVTEVWNDTRLRFDEQERCTKCDPDERVADAR